MISFSIVLRVRGRGDGDAMRVRTGEGGQARMMRERKIEKTRIRFEQLAHRKRGDSEESGWRG
jgi:hypothetical protein